MPRATQLHTHRSLVRLLLGATLLAACGQVAPPPGTPEVRVFVPAATATPGAPPPGAGTAQPEGAAGGTLVVCLPEEPQGLYPYTWDVPARRAVFEALYDSLVDTRDYENFPVGVVKLPRLEDGDARLVNVALEPGDRVYDAKTGTVVSLPAAQEVTLELAEGVRQVLPAGQTQGQAVQLQVEWTLVEGMRWEDGTSLTAHDFVFAWSVAKTHGVLEDERAVARTASFEALNARTLAWRGVPGYASTRFAVPPVSYALPEHRYALRLSPGELRFDEEANRSPLSYGPFRVQEWVQGDHLTLVKNATYWRAREGLPRLDRVIFRFVPDRARLLEELAAGACDLSSQDAPFDGTLPQLHELALGGHWQVELAPGSLFEHLDFNARPVEAYTGFAGRVKNDDGSPIFANREIRQAIAYCLDRQALIDQAANGAALILHSYLPPGHPLYAGDSQLARYGFDPAYGRALLEKNGWSDHDDDGVVDKDGEPFAFVYSTRRYPLRERVTELARAQLREHCGLDATIALHGGDFFRDGPGGALFGRQYDVAEFAWRWVSLEPPCDLYLASAIPSSANGWGAPNAGGFSNHEFDAACTEAQRAASLEAQRTLHATAQQIFAAELPALPLFVHARVVVHDARLVGVVLDGSARSELWNIEQVAWARPAQ